MRKWYSVFAMILFMLTACGRAEKDDPQAKARAEANKAVMEQMAHPKPAYRDGLFDMKLNVERTTVKRGEAIHASATFAYIGGEPKITVYGARSFLGFVIHDGHNFAMDGASTTERAPTELVQGKPLVQPFFKSGGYSSDAPDANYWRGFYAEKELILPPGKYVLAASVSFDLHEDIADRSSYTGSVYRTITVEE
ncbi:hypothetical protein GXP70_26400 [Paenibacillus lycopersici]|uniref:Uncharacterized protein n=1 Tax=Paenibacillus lycopersici TaxID=2704462 RepID=A0A6C0G5X7_9BACL|nr:hypothetical protein [Paenibacillus lycopersici]QHT63144.1 hypothetical protein GXP70_26400 [Paenibacillus lycopersici]